MNYKILASFAAIAAASTFVFAPGTTAVAKSTATAVNATTSETSSNPDVRKPQLYAAAGSFSDAGVVRLDGQPLSGNASSIAAPSAKSDGESSPMNLWALVVAGMAVMGSLAFRRSPNK